MKKILSAILVIAILSCNNSNTAPEEKAVPAAEVKSSTPANLHGFNIDYSASFEMDSAANVETVLALWREFVDGDLSKSSPHFADTVSFFFADGSMAMGAKDKLIKEMQQYRNSIKKVETKVEAVMGVKSTDKNEHWVSIWGVDFRTDDKGKTDTVSLQETWGFNKDGKVTMMFQAQRKGMLPPPPPGQ
ncbi:hypothetical protein [Pollutibacter soli]|uniref:hypothetical protein n=1 Tax=Pollutibacter soli TaxID=3034157 RepID=UPI003013D575